MTNNFFGNLDSDNKGFLSSEETYFNVLLIGSFSGKKQGLFNPLKLDRENFNSVLKSKNIHIPLQLGKDIEADIHIHEFDDFHPDNLFNKQDVFQNITNKKMNLEKEQSKKVADDQSSLQEKPSETSADDSLLDQILDVSSQNKEPVKDDWQKAIEDIVKPFVQKEAIPDAQNISDEEDKNEIIFQVMRRILHSPRFQQLESLWRGVDFILKRMDSHKNINLYILDLSFDELKEDILSTDDLSKTNIYKMLIDNPTSPFYKDGCASMGVLYSWDPTPESIQIQGRLLKIAKKSGACLLSEGISNILNVQKLPLAPDSDYWNESCDEKLKNIWNDLKELPEATSMSVLLPRFLIRMPYGRRGESLDYLDFEEVLDHSIHEACLWGNPVFLATLLLIKGFQHYGWSERITFFQDIEDLPLHIFKVGGESHMTSPSEVFMNEKSASKILSEGMIPLISFYGKDFIRLGRFQSVSSTGSLLKGRWSE